MCKNTAAAAASVGMSAAVGCVYSGGYSLFKRRGVFMSDVYSAQEPAGSLWFTLHHFGLQEEKKNRFCCCCCRAEPTFGSTQHRPESAATVTGYNMTARCSHTAISSGTGTTGSNGSRLSQSGDAQCPQQDDEVRYGPHCTDRKWISYSADLWTPLSS